MKTLVIAPNWIGDALMAQPLLTLLKAAQPTQHLTVLAPAWVAPVLAAMAEVDTVISTHLAHGSLQWRERRAFAARLREQKFDRAFVLPNSFKSALIPWLARIPLRLGYQGEARYGLLNRRLPRPVDRLPMVRRYAALAMLADTQSHDELPNELPQPRLQVAAERIEAARKKFALCTEQKLVALCPGAEFGPAKRWPAAHFAQLAIELLQRDPKTQIILLGGPGDRAIADEIRLGSQDGSQDGPQDGPQDQRIQNLAGQTSLDEALALIAASDQIVSNDSGLMHVAAALRRPQVALFGSSDPRHTPPLSSHAQVIWLHLSCSPCFARTCPLGHLNCLNDITPQQVMQAL